MQQQWRIRIRGKQREQVSVDLLVQAVMALGRQLHDEAAKDQAASSNESGDAENEARTEDGHP